LTFWAKCGIKKGKGGGAMKEKVFGCDVSKDYIILHDGSQAYKLSLENFKSIQRLVNNSIVVMEQTGAYGLRWGQVLEDLGAKVYIADGKDFKNFKLYQAVRKKDDYTDAYYLRLFFFERPKRVWRFNKELAHLRALIRQHMRNEKDITKHANRLSQYLAVIFPTKNYCDLDRKKFLKVLDEIEQELKQTPHALSGLALMELNKLRVVLDWHSKLEEEITSIARNHKDYEILKSFHGLNDILIATLMAYYWDIERFKDVDSFIGYMVMGANPEVSGTSLNRMKTDKARAEVKGKFFMLFLQSHKDNSPYKPLIDLLRSRLGGGNNQKKRYIKFLTDLLELVYYALKYRLSFSQAVAWKVKQLEREKARLRSQLEEAREQGNQEKASLLGWEHENITLNKQAWALVLGKVGRCQDIPDKSSEGAKSNGLALDGGLAGHLPYSSTCLKPSQSLEQSQTLNQEPSQSKELNQSKEPNQEPSKEISQSLKPSQTLSQEPSQEIGQGLEYALAGGGGKRKKRRR
jgi:transposase